LGLRENGNNGSRVHARSLRKHLDALAGPVVTVRCPKSAFSPIRQIFAG
jgi:hypothetical protein